MASSSVPREGRYWLLAAGVLSAIGLFKAINLLLLVGCFMLALWGLNALLAGRRLGRLRGRRSIEGPVFAGTPCAVRLEVANLRARQQLGVCLEDRGPGHALVRFLPRMGPGESVRLCDAVTLPARGRYAWGPLRASSGYPFGLFRRSVVLAPGEEVLVLPRLGRLHRGRLRHYLTPVGFAAANAPGRPRRHPSAQAEFYGLRDFRTGDSPRWIHWRSSARRGELMVREFEDVPNDNLVLVVDPGPAPDPGAGPAGREALEAVISLAATVCWEWCRQKGDRLVLAVAGPEPAVLDGVTGPDHALRLLECLAVQTGGASPEGDLADRLPALPPAPILVVSARPSALGDALAQRFNRAVASLDASALGEIDFYEGPAAS